MAILGCLHSYRLQNSTGDQWYVLNCRYAFKYPRANRSSLSTSTYQQPTPSAPMWPPLHDCMFDVRYFGERVSEDYEDYYVRLPLFAWLLSPPEPPEPPPPLTPPPLPPEWFSGTSLVVHSMCVPFEICRRGEGAKVFSRGLPRVSTKKLIA